MMKILLQSAKFSKHVDFFIDRSKKLGHDVIWCSHDDFCINYNGGKLRVFLKGKDIKEYDFDAVYFRSVETVPKLV